MDSAGFLSPDMNWKSMAISCLLLKKHFGRVTLYCNERVRDLIINTFKIPYDNVVVIPDFMDDYNGCNLWALPKVYTYSLQNEPFLHVDCDWFMFEKLPDSILGSDIIGQNIEYDDQMYNHRTLEKLISNGCILPEFVLNEYEKEPILRVINAGVLGGSNIEFIQSYLGVIKDFISANKPILKFLNDGFVNSIYEQLFFYLLAKHKNQTLGLCTPGDKLSTRFDWLPMDLTYSPKTGYMHLLANLKRRMNTYVFVNRYLNHLDMELGYRITKVCRDNGISPLINFPIWDIYSNDNSTYKQNYEDTRTKNLIDAGSVIFKGDIVFSKLSDELLMHPKTIAHNHYAYTDKLWDIKSLWDKRYTFSLSENIQISRIVPQLASAFLRDKRIGRKCIIRDNEQIYISSVPDPMMMKVITTLMYGIKVDIIDCLLSIKQANLIQIANYLNNKLSIGFNDSKTRIALDKTIRSMLVSGILKLYS